MVVLGTHILDLAFHLVQFCTQFLQFFVVVSSHHTDHLFDPFQLVVFWTGFLIFKKFFMGGSVLMMGIILLGGLVSKVSKRRLG